MRCSFYENICHLGGAFCREKGEEEEKDCPEAAKFRQIEKLPCPIMVAYGYDDRLCKCDLPLWLRAIIHIKCVVENQCVIAIYFPKIRGKICDRNLKSEEIANIIAMIKTSIRKNALDQPIQTTA
ncbi:MAG: hypothetical protein HYV53_02705 [Parcubacteria group bacterium]|nr:hypothetical protein [Parcubacteria group bacterium]